MLVPPEAVNVRIEDVVNVWEAMQVLAVPALWANSTREEQAEVGTRNLVCFGVAAVLGDVDAVRGLELCIVVAIAAAPGTSVSFAFDEIYWGQLAICCTRC